MKAKNFEVWKTIKLGTFKNREDLKQALKEGGFKSDTSLIDYGVFLSEKEKEREIDLVKVSVRKFGFWKKMNFFGDCTRLNEFYERVENSGLKLCPSEAGPQLRLQYKNQPKGECLKIAMTPVGFSTPRSTQRTFMVINKPYYKGDDKRGLYLSAYRYELFYGGCLSPDDILIFEKPRH